MKIKSLFNVFLLILIITFVSCEGLVVKKESKSLNNDKLIAQADIPTAETNTSTINELISYDIAFEELNKIVQSSEYATKFSGTKSYTIFAPLNGAFKKLPKGIIEKLVEEKNEEKLSAIINCHIIPGAINEQDIIKAINEGGGSVKLRTLGGTRLIASRKRGKIYLIDKNGNAGRLMKTDIEASNGIIHTLETVMLPKK
ncbi:Uncaracterized surface protein containing fasciclin (FAS1) repeats [Aquimarina amphilecti]|uniref:Uncaracterized surface protein containing fasciclin (FAS1) repeats n=1 Tax=Aquimarina amphilecti TaxID=1038014 RepID=A0A1H7UTG8_AQUAM|nr:fasciclin domain-containing protein [Aquimarina amphilecti]SEL99948.1 Uncaracterized surface protein containing fasciclin (FAS1) repeats [Aquimarina amphilecti]